MTNQCFLCAAEAVARCYTCGELFCAKHGTDNCQRCDTAIVAGDPRPQNVSVAPFGDRPIRPGWWRPQLAEDYEPPACYACKGLTRRICQNCQSFYCRDHAGRGNLCDACARSARLGLVIFVIAIGALIALLTLGSIVNR